MVKNTNNKNSKKEEKKPKDKRYNNKVNYCTHEGHKLTVKEAKFIDLYIETGNQRQSVIEAGYKNSCPGQYAQEMLSKQYIASEIEFRLQKLEDAKIASAKEILEYFTGVMRGEVKDQFGLDTPLSERTRAAQELAKRQIDIANKVSGEKEANNTITIKLDWDGISKTPENGEN